MAAPCASTNWHLNPILIMSKLDLHAMIDLAEFAPPVWDFLLLLEDIVIATQEVIMPQDEHFKADTPFKQLLLSSINRDITTMTAIYILLRCEFLHQAAAHVRLFCESLISLRYIAQDVSVRVPQFLQYADVEGYEVAEIALKWEEEGAQPVHVERVRAMLSRLKPAYDRAKPLFVTKTRKGERPFINWCNTTIKGQADRCGPRVSRLYELVYSQLSAYVHGSAWSLRRQLAYSRKHYDARVVLNDIATIVRTTLVVWGEWANFCDEQLGCSLSARTPGLATTLDRLDAKHFSREAKPL